MKVFGITGGSGSGKSTASSIFADLGVEVIDADVISREITEPNSECLAELVQRFGNGILKKDGTLNRKKLASLAFSDENNLKKLNSVTHCYIKAEIENRIAASNAEWIAIDGAVIIGSIIEPLCEFIITVTADRCVRERRICERDALSKKMACERIAAQPDDVFYKTHSKYIIYNNGSFEDLKKQVLELYDQIREV